MAKTPSLSSGRSRHRTCGSRACGPSGPPGHPDLLSFAVIMDEPPKEIRAAGHDRCPIPLRPDNVDAWLRPDIAKPHAQYAILDNRARPFTSTVWQLYTAYHRLPASGSASSGARNSSPNPNPHPSAGPSVARRPRGRPTPIDMPARFASNGDEMVVQPMPRPIPLSAQPRCVAALGQGRHDFLLGGQLGRRLCRASCLSGAISSGRPA